MITTEDLKRLSKNARDIEEIYQQHRRDLAFLPQYQREAILKLEDEIREAAQNNSGALRTLITMLGEKVLKVKDHTGDTPAHIAARHNSDSLKILINAFGYDLLRVKDNSGETVVSHANRDALKLLIDSFGVEVLAARDCNGDTPLHSAARNNRDSFKFLIETLHKTDFFTERNYEGNTALHLAIRNGNGDLLQSFIEKYPEIIESFLSAKNIKGNTPLHFAAEYDKDFFEFLIEKFGDKIDNDHTVLYVAAERNKDSLELLIEKFPETIESLLSMQDDKSRTILHIAALYNKGSLELLVERFPEIMKTLLPKQTAAGHTPLHLSTGNEGAFKLLIEKFPEQVINLLYVENKSGKTVLKYALTDCPDALPKEYQPPQKSCVILGNKDDIPIPGIPKAFASYYQDQVALLLKLRLEDVAPGALKSVNVLEENYTLRESNEDNIAEKLSSFILTSNKNTILMPLNIGGSHLVGIAAVKDGNNVVIHYMDSELGLPPESLLMKIESVLESYGSSMELRIAEVERQKYSNCGPEVIENLTAFASKEPRSSQEEAILKHSIALERHLLKDSDNIDYADVSIPFASTAIFSSPYAMLDEKLLAQLQHYLRTGEAFDIARAAIEDGTVYVTHQPFMLDETTVTNIEHMQNTTQIYHEESYHDSNAEFSPDINMVAIIGLLCSVLVTSSETPELII